MTPLDILKKFLTIVKMILNLPDVRLLRPRTLVIYDNLKKEIFYIINIFNDEKIKNYQKNMKKLNRTF